MEEPIEKDISVNGVLGSSSLVAISEGVVLPTAGDGKNLVVGDVMGEDQGLNEGSLIVEMEGGFSDRADRVVGVIATEVANDGAGGSVDVDGRTGFVDDLGSGKSKDSGFEGLENELGDNTSRDVEISKEAEPAVEGVTMKDEDVRLLENKLHDQAVANGLGDLVGETKPVDLVDQANAANEDIEMTSDGEQDEERNGLRYEELEMEIDNQDSDCEEMETIEQKSVKRETSISESYVNVQHPRYRLPLDEKTDFSVSDLVWGKVRSHPWWPGQIFDPSDASEKAMKYRKKDSFLVAYFGDGTFAWNEASGLKPFRSYFSRAENQSSSEAFQNAVDCALEEVLRRVEQGLTCICVVKDIDDKIKFQVIENAGIREEVNLRGGFDESSSSDSFEPGNFLEYLKDLAQSPTSGANKLELVIAKSQLLAFNRSRGCLLLPEWQSSEELPENADYLEFEDEEKVASDQEISQARRGSSNKRKHNLKDIMYTKKKDRSVSELMSSSWDLKEDEIGSSPSSRKKGKGLGNDVAASDDKKRTSLAKVSTPALHKPSFKVGECMRRVASQMTGSPSILKPNNNPKPEESNEAIGDGENLETKGECSSFDELLLHLHLAAQDPLEGSHFGKVVDFFSDFRNSITIDQPDLLVDKKRKGSGSIGHSPETYEFEDMNDTYWTDRVIENGSEDTLQSTHKSRKRDSQLTRVNGDKSFRRSNSKKRSDGNNFDQATEKPSKPVDYRDENASAELLMHFPVVDSVPSEVSLNRMFKRFGPLLESKTEVDRDTNRARVVFKRCADAESAYSSAQKFNIFGQTLVNYQLNYKVTVPFKTIPLSTSQSVEEANIFLEL